MITIVTIDTIEAREEAYINELLAASRAYQDTLTAAAATLRNALETARKKRAASEVADYTAR